MRKLATALVLAFFALVFASAAQAEGRGGARARRGVLKRGLQLYHHLKRQNRGRPLDGAQLARLKGRLFHEQRQLLQRRKVALAGRAARENLDPTFRGNHPAFRRLVRSGWFGRGKRIAGLQRLANGLKSVRRKNLKTPLDQVEFLVFDLEASGGNAGRLRKGDKRFLSGWSEVTQFGYTIFRGGKKIRSGSIPIRPTVSIDPQARRVTGLTNKKLANAPRFEDAASKILELMKGRVLVGQSAIRMDWSWLQSSFARLGVSLPRPKRMILDTYLLSFNHFPHGAGVAKLSETFGVKQQHHHDARYDAEATAGVFWKLLKKNNVRTLGDAFALQHQGHFKMKNQPRQ